MRNDSIVHVSARQAAEFSTGAVPPIVHPTTHHTRHITMPPKRAAASGASRKGPQFKPPRPAKDATTAPAKRASAAAAKKTAARPTFRPAATIISSDDEDEPEEPAREVTDIFNDDDLMEDLDSPTRQPPPIADTPSPIPAPLLARLLYENFEDPDTQIQKGAMELVGKYMEIFVREAFARAKKERERGVRDGGVADDFLQVEDLEKLAPQLVLDF